MYGYVSLDSKTEWKYESNENMVVDVRAFFPVKELDGLWELNVMSECFKI